MMRYLMAGAALCCVGAGGMAASVPATEFGARDNVLDVSISPDGKSLAIIKPTVGRGAVVMVAKLDGTPEMKPVLSSTGSPDRLESCHWASDTRLVCEVYMIDAVYGQRMGISRMIAVNADGSGLKQLSAQQHGEMLGFATYGGDVIDWTGGKGEGSVLMTRVFVPEASTGTMLSQNGQGMGVERVDTRTLARQTVETPNAGAVDYISDGRGHVRVMGIARSNSVDESTGAVVYRYRKKDSRDWLPLDTVNYANYHAEGFEPLAVDPDLDVVYGRDKSNGREALYKIALDGSMKKQLVLDRPDADVDRLIQVGRQDRVVGASWVTEKRTATMFDPELKRFADALSRALPNAPNVNIVDASGDGQRLVLFAGSDTDPGRFYLFDKPTKHLTEILPVRPQLATTKLAEMTPIHFQAADGTSIPAYLTLPPGSSGKNLPAIVLPHGGPTYRDEWNFDWLPQYFANRGFAVIQPEFRGSSGYGDEWFQKNGIRSWRLAIGDVDDAGHWLVKQGIADPGKLAIVGWSYGGYAALQSQVVDPRLFKAVVAIAPVADFGLMKTDAEKGTTTAQTNAIFGDATVAQEGSPARHADRFAAPVLMFQGDVDQNVPITQSRLMEARLKGAGKSVERYEYKGLDHQLDDDQVRADMLDKSDAFLRKALKM